MSKGALKMVEKRHFSSFIEGNGVLKNSAHAFFLNSIIDGGKSLQLARCSSKPRGVVIGKGEAIFISTRLAYGPLHLKFYKAF